MVEHSIDNREAAGSTPASRTSFFCGQVNRCHAGLISHASGVQLASPQPIPPNSPGRPLRSRRRSEKPDKHVRLVLLAPSVAVAEWLRRQTVDLSTRVRFPPVTPLMLSLIHISMSILLQTVMGAFTATLSTMSLRNAASALPESSSPSQLRYWRASKNIAEP